MLSPREVLFACPPSPFWCPPSFTAKFTLFSPCARSDPPLSRQGVVLAHLHTLLPHDLVICTDDSVSFSFNTLAMASLPTAHFLALRPLFSFLQTQFSQVCPLKPAPISKLSTGLGSTNKLAISLFLSNSLPVLATPSSPPSFLLLQTSSQELSSFSFTIWLQWISGHSFFPGNNADA